MSAFDKIIGYSAIKKELRQISDTLKNKDVYAGLGVSAPKGLLLYGEPGVGKSLMASAIIEESGRKVFTCRKDKPNGDFVKEIKATFDKAAENAPSKLIRNNPDWEDVLLQAESHPFFKGSVSFLIPNDNSINGFIHNFEMSKLLFDANGVSPKYQSNSHILLRALLSKYNALTDIKYHITDKKEKENSLKNMLASDPVVRAAFAEWLSLPTEADIYNKLLDEIAKESPIPVGVNDFDKKLHQLLYKTTDLVDWMQQYGAIRYKDNYISRPSSSYDWIYVYGYSNEIITELIARGWSCENTCNIGEEPNKKDIPYYWSAAGREIDVSKSVCNNGNTVLQRCSVGSEEITLMVDDTIIEALNYNALVTDVSGIKKFVDDIEKKYNDKICGEI